MPILIALIIEILLALWVHKDAKAFRSKGVAVTPGLWSTLVFLGSVPLFLIYILLRIFYWNKEAKQSALPALPPAPAWTNWLTIIILVFVVGGILFFIYMSSQYQLPAPIQQTAQNPLSAPPQDVPLINTRVPSPSSTLGNWKTYNNKKLAFTFDYPSDWKSTECSAALSDSQKSQNNGVWECTFPDGKEVGGPGGEVVNITISSDQNQGAFLRTIVYTPEHNWDLFLKSLPQDGSVKSINVNGYLAVRRDELGDNTQVYIQGPKGGYVALAFHANTNQDNANFDRILATFKFY